jgi:hypothetical protein
MKVSRQRSILVACTFALVGLIFSSPDAHAQAIYKEKQSKQKNKVSCTGPGCKWCPDGYVSVNNRDPCVRIGKKATQKVKQKEAQQKKDKEILNNLIKQKKIAEQQKNYEMLTNIQKMIKDHEKNSIRNIR